MTILRITSLVNHQVQNVMDDYACNAEDDCKRTDKKTQRANGDKHQQSGGVVCAFLHKVFSSFSRSKFRPGLKLPKLSKFHTFFCKLSNTSHSAIHLFLF